MKIKLKFFILSIGSLIMLNSITLCNESGSTDFDKFFDPCAQEITPPEPLAPEAGLNCLSAIDILPLITPEGSETCQAETDVCPPSGCLVNLPNILRQNLYLYTNGPIKRRSLLDEPSLRDYCLDHCMWHVVAHPFYNWTPRVPFIRNCEFVNSYINLTNQNVINEVMNTLEVTGCSTSIDVPGILGLFNNIKLQQHRAGVMFSGCTSFDRLSLTLRAPIYYLLEHYYLSPAEIEAIENAPYFTNEEAYPENIYALDDVKTFGKRHLISDKAGIGDMRFDALLKVYDNDILGVWFGLAATFPTAGNFIKGVLGTKHRHSNKIPEFNIKKLFDLYLCPSTTEGIREAGNIISEITTEFLVGILDRLSTILINTPLGNGGHFGIGPHLDIALKFNNHWLLHTYGAFQGFASKYEVKYFLTRKCNEDFNRDYRDEATAEENLRFLNDQIIHTFYPTPIKINVHPRFDLRVAESLECDYAKWHGLIGLDYWYQAKAKFGCVSKLKDRFFIEKNIDFSAQQLKVFLNFGYRSITLCDKVFWDLEFTGDKDIWSNNVGSSLTVAFRLTLDF
ncbi:hypothetical protein [Candidatus Babela massiliensis]|uniref:Uncharacterized protein n=1 Tax=Candidatus Babela massiliensis TaxID=673862 RepID=V6DH80_9BACT|nr:hypothetical protein [Candidatus Babela massiliensis]CDK30915.1 hypothetical protein BABL1_gene_49 [Candidatus Babela massiliensis]